MIYCTKHISRPVLGVCADCEKLREQEHLKNLSALAKAGRIPNTLWRRVSGQRRVLCSWICHFWRYLVSETGYRLVVPLFVTLLSGYFGLYAVMEARHERGVNRALFERATFMSMVSSGDKGSIVAALKDFGPIQTMRVPSEPALWPLFSNWFFTEYQPNMEPMWIWALNFFPLCTKKDCGNTNIDQGYRLDLSRAKLRGALLREVDLHNALLTDADLTNTDLRESSLVGANLSNAYMDGADLRRSSISKTNFTHVSLHGADLRDTIFGLTYAGLPRNLRNTINKPPTAAILFRADLEDAKLDRAQFYETDLQEVKGLTSKQLNMICVDNETLRIIKTTLKPPPRICTPEEKPKS